MEINFVYLIIGATLAMLGIFRFTFYRRRFTKAVNVGGFTLSSDSISLLLFVVGFAFILLFAIHEIQPLFYKGREMKMEPGNY